MSSAAVPSHWFLLAAKNLMDRNYAEPIGHVRTGGGRLLLNRTLGAAIQSRFRRDAPSIPSNPSDRARQGNAAQHIGATFRDNSGNWFSLTQALRRG